MTKPPIQPTKVIPNPFGEFTEAQMEGAPGAPDRFYLKGYSDKRHQREIDLKTGTTPSTLNHRFQFVSVERIDGSKNRNKQVEWQSKGYRPVQYADLESLGIDPKESTVECATDGTAHVGSQLLMVCDAATAARHYRDQRAATERQFEERVKSKLDQAVEKYNAKNNHTSKSGTASEVTGQLVTRKAPEK